MVKKKLSEEYPGKKMIKLEQLVNAVDIAAADLVGERYDTNSTVASFMKQCDRLIKAVDKLAAFLGR